MALDKQIIRMASLPQMPSIKNYIPFVVPSTPKIVTIIHVFCDLESCLLIIQLMPGIYWAGMIYFTYVYQAYCKKDLGGKDNRSLISKIIAYCFLSSSYSFFSYLRELSVFGEGKSRSAPSSCGRLTF